MSHIWVICRKQQIDSRKTVTVTESAWGWFQTAKQAQSVVDGIGNEKYFVMSIPAAEEINKYTEELVNGRIPFETGYK